MDAAQESIEAEVSFNSPPVVQHHILQYHPDYCLSGFRATIALLSTGAADDAFLQCLTSLVMGGTGLSRLGRNFGLTV